MNTLTLSAKTTRGAHKILNAICAETDITLPGLAVMVRHIDAQLEDCKPLGLITKELPLSIQALQTIAIKSGIIKPSETLTRDRLKTLLSQLIVLLDAINH